MSQQLTLRSIFEASKEQLVSSLSGLMLPKDFERVQSVISEYLNQVCDENSDYRQNLTQSEDYILQAALSMLNAQRAMVDTFDCMPEIKIEQPVQPSQKNVTKMQNLDEGFMKYKKGNISTTTLIGAGSGAIVGKLIFGGWGAVFGAIAGTAVSVYLSQQSPNTKIEASVGNASIEPKVTISETPVNTATLMSVIGQICESLDNLIETFRAQIRRVVDKYESQEKPTIERDFRVLLEGVQSLIGYKRGHSSEEEKYLTKLQTRVEDLAEILDNYNLEAVDYTPEHSDWFEAVESKNTTEIKLVNPAIVKGGVLVLKGKIFIPLK